METDNPQYMKNIDPETGLPRTDPDSSKAAPGAPDGGPPSGDHSSLNDGAGAANNMMAFDVDGSASPSDDAFTGNDIDPGAFDSAEELTLNNDAFGDDNMLDAGTFDESNESSSSSSFGGGESETYEYIEG